jgi:hypothetical protein
MVVLSGIPSNKILRKQGPPGGQYQAQKDYIAPRENQGYGKIQI